MLHLCLELIISNVWILLCSVFYKVVSIRQKNVTFCLSQCALEIAV